MLFKAVPDSDFAGYRISLFFYIFSQFKIIKTHFIPQYLGYVYFKYSDQSKQDFDEENKVSIRLQNIFQRLKLLLVKVISYS